MCENFISFVKIADAVSNVPQHAESVVDAIDYVSESKNLLSAVPDTVVLGKDLYDIGSEIGTITDRIKREGEKQSQIGVGKGVLRVRDGAGTSHNFVGNIMTGTSFEILGTYPCDDGTSGNWYKIRWNGLEGYVAALMVDIE